MSREFQRKQEAAEVSAYGFSLSGKDLRGVSLLPQYKQVRHNTKGGTCILFMHENSKAILNKTGPSAIRRCAIDATFNFPGTIWGTTEGKEDIQVLTIWGCDGDFEDGSQLHFPLAVGILDRKNKDSYRQFCQMVKEEVPNFNPEVFTCDFETAMVTEFALAFSARFHGCIFHFQQANRRRMVSVMQANVFVFI
jgi:hypothetical protein